MNTPVLLEGFAAELIRRGLPHDYAQSTAAELADHHRDLVEELSASGLGELEAEIAAGQRLGERRMLVKKSVRDYQKRYWCARWPLFTFLLGPFALMIAAWVSTYVVVALALLGVMKITGLKDTANDGVISAVEAVMLNGFSIWFFIVIPAVVVAYLARRAFRAGMRWRWVAFSAVLLSLVVGNVQCRFPSPNATSRPTNLETGEPIKGDTIMFCFPYWLSSQSFRAISAWYLGNPQVLLQLLTPLGVAGWVLWRFRRANHGWEEPTSLAC